MTLIFIGDTIDNEPEIVLQAECGVLHGRLGCRQRF